MKFRVQLLDIDLIRRFGGAVVELTDSQINKYGNKVKKLNQIVENRMITGPKEDTTVWIPPESKIVEKFDENYIYPDKFDKLFSQIKD